MSPGIAQNVAAQSFLSTPYQATKLLACFTNTDSDSNITQWKDLENYHNSSLSLKRSLKLELLENQFNNSTPENSNDPVKISSSKYDIEEMHNIEMPHKNKSLSLFHINAYVPLIKILMTFNIS